MRALYYCILTSFVTSPVWAAMPVQPYTPGQGGKDAMMANSPFTAYTAHVATYLLLATVLVLTLLVGGFLIVNLSLMSKRSIDKGLGGQEPSDVGILKGERFNAGNTRRVLPPEEDSDQDRFGMESTLPPHEFDPKAVLHEEDMAPDVPVLGGGKKKAA